MNYTKPCATEVHKITRIPKNVWTDFYRFLEEDIFDMDNEKLKHWKYEFFSQRGYHNSENTRKTLLNFFQYLLKQGKVQSEDDIVEFNKKLDPSIRLNEKGIKNILRLVDQIHTKREIPIDQKDTNEIIQEKNEQIKNLKEKIKRITNELDQFKKEIMKSRGKQKSTQKDKDRMQDEERMKKEKETEIKNLRKRLTNLQRLFDGLEMKMEVTSQELPENKLIREKGTSRSSIPEYTYLPWWEKINLFSDPFPSNQGLNKIDKDFYDDIVLRTEIFNKYLFLIEKMPNEILNNILIVYGEYGSGKTTFFQYLERPLLNSGILPIYLMISSSPLSEKIKKEFHRQFLREIIDSNSASGKVGYLYPHLGVEASIETIYDQLNDILMTTDYKGFFVFIDGLHKEAKHSESVLEFIKLLQNDFEYLSSFKKIPISFIIAGCLDWKTFLEKDPNLTGSKTGEENIPDISSLEAFHLINMRFRTFSRNNNEIFQLNEEIISKIWSNLKKTLGRGIVPRDMIDNIRDLIKNKLEGKRIAKKFSISLTDIPFKITPDILIRIRTKVANNPQINKIINSGIASYFGNDKEGFQSCLEDFIKIYYGKKVRVSESGKIDHAIDIENLRVLEEFNFLERRDHLLQSGSTVSKSGTQKLAKEIRKQRVIKVERNLERFIEGIEEEMNLRVEDYIQEIYKTKERTIRNIRRSVRENPDITVISLNELKRREVNGRIKILIEKAISEHEKILEHKLSVKGIIPKEQIIGRTSDSIHNLLGVILSVEENLNLTDRSSSEVKELWDNYWFSCNDYLNFESQIIRIKRDHIQITALVENNIVQSYTRAFESLVNLIEDLKNCDKILRINYIGLKNEDKKELHKIRLDYMNDEYANSAKELIAYFEPKIQIFIQNCLEIKYGNKWRKKLPSDINERIEERQKKDKLTSRISFQEPEYLLRYCSFDDYKKIIISNWSDVFESQMKEWNRLTFESLYSNFRELRNKTEHNDVEWLNKNHHEIKKGMEFVRDIFENFNQMNYEILSRENIFYEEKEDKPGEGYIFFSFKENKDRVDSYKSVIRFNELGRFVDSLKKKEVPEIQLELTREEGYEYGLEYRKYISFLAFLIFHNYVSLKELRNGIVIADIRGIAEYLYHETVDS